MDNWGIFLIGLTYFIIVLLCFTEKAKQRPNHQKFIKFLLKYLGKITWISSCFLGLIVCISTPVSFRYICSSRGYGFPFPTSEHLCGCNDGVPMSGADYQYPVILIGYIILWLFIYLYGARRIAIKIRSIMNIFFSDDSQSESEKT